MRFPVPTALGVVFGQNAAQHRLTIREGKLMGLLGRLPLESGGEVLFETVEDLESSELAGPVKAGRVADAVRELPQTLQGALQPVREMAGAVVAQLREVGPAEVEVEFGVNLSAEIGVVVSKGEAAAHLRVRVLWQRGSDASDGV